MEYARQKCLTQNLEYVAEVENRRLRILVRSCTSRLSSRTEAPLLRSVRQISRLTWSKSARFGKLENVGQCSNDDDADDDVRSVQLTIARS